MPGLGTNLPGSNTPGPTLLGAGGIPGTISGQSAAYPFGTGSPFGGISAASGSVADGISGNLPEVPGGASSYTILPFPQARGQSDLSLQPFPNVRAGGQTAINIAPSPPEPPRLGPFGPSLPLINPSAPITLEGLRNSPDPAAWLRAILVSGRAISPAVNAYRYVMNSPTARIDPSGLAMLALNHLGLGPGNVVLPLGSAAPLQTHAPDGLVIAASIGRPRPDPGLVDQIRQERIREIQRQIRYLKGLIILNLAVAIGIGLGWGVDLPWPARAWSIPDLILGMPPVIREWQDEIDRLEEELARIQGD